MCPYLVAPIAVKLRIRDNSVRLRLQRGEVNALCDVGSVTAHTGFPGGGVLRYSIECAPLGKQAEAILADNSITVRLPELLVHSWARSTQVSITGEQQLDDGTVLQILVEKDFACLAPRAGEDQSDMYPHPSAAGKDAC